MTDSGPNVSTRAKLAAVDPWQKNIIFTIATRLSAGVETSSVTQKKSFGGLAWHEALAVYGIRSSLDHEAMGIRAAVITVIRKNS